LGESPDAHKTREPNSQLPDLASALFACVHERMGWLQRHVRTEKWAVFLYRCLLAVLLLASPLERTAKSLRWRISSSSSARRF
jgi:hypothetical protein